MTPERNHALVEMMNEIGNSKTLERLSNEIFEGVVPFRNREAQDHVVRSTVTLLAAGTEPEIVAKALHGVGTFKREPEWFRNVVERVCSMAEARASARNAATTDIGTTLRAAFSYLEVIDGSAAPSPELEELAGPDQDYNGAGMKAMLGVMRFLQNPHAHDLTAETVKVYARIAAATEIKAQVKADRLGAEIREIIADDDGSVQVVVGSKDGREETLQIIEPAVSDTDNDPSMF